MSSRTDPVARADTALAQRAAPEDDASIVWERDPADAEEAERAGSAVPAEPAVPTVSSAPAVPTVSSAPTASSTSAAPTAPADGARMWSDDAVQALRGRWRQVQLRFVDDPAGAVRDAEALVTEATDQLAAIIAARRDELAVPGGADTERLRLAVRHYRVFLDRVLEL